MAAIIEGKCNASIKGTGSEKCGLYPKMYGKEVFIKGTNQKVTVYI